MCLFVCVHPLRKIINNLEMMRMKIMIGSDITLKSLADFKFFCDEFFGIDFNVTISHAHIFFDDN